MIKICTKCNNEKQFPEDFYKVYKKRDGSYCYDSSCKKCRSKQICENNFKTGKVKTPRGIPKNDLIDKVFGKLTVVKYSGRKIFNNYKRHVWLCKCECGNEKIISELHLKNNNIKSCGCIRKLRGKNNLHYKGYKEISGVYWQSLKRGAKNRNIEFDITIEYIWDLFEKQNKKCAISKIDIMLYSDYLIKNIASLDRIDNTKGYIKGNVQWLHKHVNIMKNSHNQDYFIDLCKSIVKNNS